MNKILIIDDEKNIQVSLANILEDEGYKLFFASSGEEGIEKFTNIRPDVVFLDIWLPGIDGLETMRKIMSIDPFQIIIMISGHGNITTAVSAVKDGAYDFLEKPLSIDKVVFVLKRGIEYRKILEENRKLKSLIEDKNLLVNEKPYQQKIKRENTGDINYLITDINNSKHQKTIRKSNIFYGIGLHSGEKTGMVIKPLPAGKGIRFENISEEGYIPARIEYLNSTSYATSIKKDNLEANTIEHFMATLHAAGITNLAIKINKEVPILDGSASQFCQFIKESGIVEQNDVIPEIVITEPLEIKDINDAERFIRIEPADVLTIQYTTVYPQPLGVMTYTFTLNSFSNFEKEIAPARTFGFVDELNKLVQLGLAEGGRLNNFILIDKGKVVNTDLRFPDEIVRHKILDILGDFYLLGRPLRGKIIAQKSGHFFNTQMVNLINEKYLSSPN
jgi:UDP-3-O-[3-hydroxymyristoyl] N-acetylglucosamine deacetylase